MVAGHTAAAVLLVPVLGLLAFGVGSTLITRVLYEAADAPSLAGAFATSALNVGAALGPLLGGAAIDGGLGYRSPVWVSVLLMAPAFTAPALGPVVERLRPPLARQAPPAP